MKLRFIFSLMFILLLPFSVFAQFDHIDENEYIFGKVVKIIDGDTIVVQKNNKNYTIDIYGIDAPELNQNYGKESKKALSEMLRNYEVGVHFKGKSEDRNKTGYVNIMNAMNVSFLMIEKCQAWISQDYCKQDDCSTFEAFHNSCKSSKKGIWSQDGVIVTPWDFRSNVNNNSQ